MDIFLNHPWPGNVRQLENVINDAVLHCDSDQIAIKHLSEEFLIKSNPYEHKSIVAEELGSYRKEEENIPAAISNLEREKITAALKKNRWNKTKTAKSMGLTRSQLLYRLKKYGFE